MGTMSKLGLHIHSPFEGELGQPGIVKLLDPTPEYMASVRQKVGAECTMVVRWYEKEQPLDNPVERAREWYAKRRTLMADKRIIWEGYNEIPRELRALFAAFETERMRLMHADGNRVGVGSMSVGTPELEDWNNEYAPMVDAMGPSDAMALHEYIADAADIANVWHLARFSMVPRLANRDIVITELGRDRFRENGREFGYSGWHADPNCTANAYLAELRSINAVYMRYPRVLGATIYTAGTIIDPRWLPFEVNSLASIIAAENRREVTQPVKPRLVHPLTWGRVSQPFGANPELYRPYGIAAHNGDDIAVPAGVSVFDWHGAPVVAAHDGHAVVVRDDSSYGIYVYIWGSWCDTLYAHLAESPLPGSTIAVKAGSLLGWVGYTGNVLPRGIKGEHLHFGVRPKPYQMNNGYRGYVDPAQFLTA